MAAFCSAIAMSWNQIPCTWSARASICGENSEMSAVPCSTASNSGSWRRATSRSAWNRISRGWSAEMPVITGGAKPLSETAAGTAWRVVGHGMGIVLALSMMR